MNATTGTAVMGVDSAIGRPLFKAPSAEEAAHILRTLKWGEHYIATEMNSSSGSRQIYLYSLAEAARFFEGEAASGAVAEGRRGMICWVDKEPFIAWIGKVIGDVELACALTKSLAEQMTGFDEAVTMHALLNTRVAQLKGIVDP